MNEVKIMNKGKELRVETPSITLISCASMSEILDDEDIISCDFNAEIHANHFRSIFKQFYYLDLEKWAVCAVADNTYTNHKVASLLGIPHVGCLNHLLNLNVN